MRSVKGELGEFFVGVSGVLGEEDLGNEGMRVVSRFFI